MILEILLILSSGVLGLFVGAQITEAVLLVPHWKELTPDDFFELHKTFGPRIYRFFAPLTIAATIIPLLTSIYIIMTDPLMQISAWIMGISTLLFFLSFFLYFKKANKSFEDRSLTNDELPAELIRWGNWHWGRIFFECIALASSLFLLAGL
jgi:hypothetical protein